MSYLRTSRSWLIVWLIDCLTHWQFLDLLSMSTQKNQTNFWLTASPFSSDSQQPLPGPLLLLPWIFIVVIETKWGSVAIYLRKKKQNKKHTRLHFLYLYQVGFLRRDNPAFGSCRHLCLRHTGRQMNTRDSDNGQERKQALALRDPPAPGS